MLQAFNNCGTPNPSVLFPCTSKFRCPPNFHVLNGNALQSGYTHNNSPPPKKGDSVKFMEGYYVVGVTTIPYLGFGVIINIVSKEDNSYRVTIIDIPHCTTQTSRKCLLTFLEKEENGCIAKQLHHLFRFLCKVDYDNDKFNHALMFTNNKVICLLELVGVVGSE